MGDNSPDTLKLIRDPTTIKSRIFIGNMPTNGTDKKDIDEIFSKYGKVTAISMNRGFAFVQFDNESSASEAIKNEAGRMLQNKKLDIKHALRGKQKSPDRGRERSPIGDKWGGGGMEDSDRRRGARDWGGAEWKDWKDRFDLGFGSRGRPGIDEPFPPTEYPLGNAPFKAVAADYPPPANIAQVDRTNDCEIIVFNKAITEYAEYIELRLKKVGLTVDLLFPNEDVPLGRVLANISGRGSLYAIVVTPQNEEHRSLTVNILHGQHQEHRNMPMEDAISLITRNFDLYLRGERSGGSALGTPVERHPEAIQTLLNLLQQNRQLTVLQYDKVIRYLQEKREVQVKLEVGDAKDLPALIGNKEITPAKHTELQNRIMNILNKTGGANNADTPSPVPAPGRYSGSNAPSVTAGHTTHSTGPGTNSGGAPPLLNDPTVQKALDNLIQGDLLRKITPGSVPAPVPAPQPLFGAYGQGRKY